MKQQVFLSLIVGLLFTASSAAAQSSNAGFRRPTTEAGYFPPAGVVPNSSVAKRIAEAVWLPIYGKSIEEEKPFRAVLYDNEVWVVQGTLPKRYDVGGVAYIEINKRDGRILKVIHGR